MSLPATIRFTFFFFSEDERVADVATGIPIGMDDLAIAAEEEDGLGLAKLDFAGLAVFAFFFLATGAFLFPPELLRR